MLVSDLNLQDKRYKRAGILPYTIQNNIKLFAFGLSMYDGSLDDFGGTREKSDIDALETAMREYREESLNIFGTLNREALMNMEVFDNEIMFLILLPVPPPISIYVHRFSDLIKDDTAHECQGVVWLTKDQVLMILEAKQPFAMYWKVANTLRENKDRL